MSNIFSGLITALITPFKDGKISWHAVDKLLDHQIDAGVAKIVLAGSTGEGVTLSEDEKLELFEYAASYDKRLQVIASISDSSTSRAIEFASKVSKVGVKALMCTSPSYNKPNQRGIYEHFRNIHDNTDLPIMLYNHPGRTGVNITVETIVALAKLPRIVAIKDANSDFSRVLDLYEKAPDLYFLAGDDVSVLSAMANGAKGLVSVMSNLEPARMKKVIDHCFKNDFTTALQQLRELFELINLTSIDVNPVPIKYLCSKNELCEEEVRLPLVIMEEGAKREFKL